MLGRGLKVFIGTCAMADGGVKKFEEELEVINNSLKGKKTIGNVKVLADVPTNNSKDDMFGVIKELYNFSKKMLTCLKDSKNTVPSLQSPGEIQTLITQQLTDVLPRLLEEALRKHSESDSKLTEKVEDVKRVPATSHTLAIEKIQVNEEEENEENRMTKQEWSTVVSKDVRKTLKAVPVIKASHPLDGTAKLYFKSKEHMDQAQEALKLKYKVTSKTTEHKKLDPKLTISDLDPDITTADILEEKLFEKNDFIRDLKEAGETCKIVFFDDKERFAVLQVSSKMRASIRQNNDKVCVDLVQYSVRDRIHVVQCFHCQQYGHMSGSIYCRQKDSDPTCFYCAGSHASKDCNRRKDKKAGSIKCANCDKSKNRGERSKCTTHKASDTLCPFFIRAKERIMDRTVGCEEAKNIYLQRVKDLQRRYGRV